MIQHIWMISSSGVHIAPTYLLSHTQKWLIRKSPNRSLKTLPNGVATLLFDGVKSEGVVAMLDRNKVLRSILRFDYLGRIFNRIHELVLFHEDVIIVHPKHTQIVRYRVAHLIVILEQSYKKSIFKL